MAVELAKKQAALQDGDEHSRELAVMMGRVMDGLTAYEAGSYLLTDDKAPVELLGMKVIDGLIEEEVAYYKRIYEERGIRGLLESF